MGELTHIDLFSGIGGFALACRWNGIRTIQMVELDPFCQKVLKKNFPGVPIEPDIKQFDGKKYAGSFILTGGFPCQPFSCAGKRNGKEDDRFLWPEMLRVISEVRPRWIIGENVAGIRSMELVNSDSAVESNPDIQEDGENDYTTVLDGICNDLEGIGYEVQPIIIPACAVNAPHRRDRVWICAHSLNGEHGTERGQAGEKNSIQGINREALRSGRIERTDSDAPDSNSERLQRESVNIRSEGKESNDEQSMRCGGEWQENWLEVAQRFCKLDARISNRLDGCLTLLETHGIMGFILMLRRYHYATSEKTRTREVLPILQKAFGEESVSRCFRRLSEVFEAENLWCPVHGEIDGEREENKIGIPEGSCEVPGGLVREVRSDNSLVNSPQGRRLDKQCTCEFDDIVFELSSEIALGEWKRNSKKAENILFDLWKESRGERFLHEPLPALYEIWRSVTDQEIGAFRRHYNMRDRDRVNRLKALGNSIVPQVAFILMNAILKVEKQNG